MLSVFGSVFCVFFEEDYLKKVISHSRQNRHLFQNVSIFVNKVPFSRHMPSLVFLYTNIEGKFHLNHVNIVDNFQTSHDSKMFFPPPHIYSEAIADAFRVLTNAETSRPAKAVYLPGCLASPPPLFFFFPNEDLRLTRTLNLNSLQMNPQFHIPDRPRSS